MKRWLIALPALLLAGQIALAHPPGPPTAEMMDKMAQDLGLDANQKQQVQKIFEEQHARMQQERKLYEATGQRPTHEQMHAKREQARQDLDAQLSTVLTTEQLEKLHQKMDEMRRSWHERKPETAPPADAPANQG